MVGFLCIFSTEGFQCTLKLPAHKKSMISDHISCICLIVSTVCFQMSPQMACPRECIVTLVAFVWLFSSVCCQMCPQITCLSWGKVTLVWSFLHCVFLNVSSNYVQTRMHNYTALWVKQCNYKRSKLCKSLQK